MTSPREAGVPGSSRPPRSQRPLPDLAASRRGPGWRPGCGCEKPPSTWTPQSAGRDRCGQGRGLPSGSDACVDACQAGVITGTGMRARDKGVPGPLSSSGPELSQQPRLRQGAGTTPGTPSPRGEPSGNNLRAHTRVRAPELASPAPASRDPAQPRPGIPSTPAGTVEPRGQQGSRASSGWPGEAALAVLL